MKFIIESTPKKVSYDIYSISEIESKILENIPLSKSEINYLLDYVCYETRLKFNKELDDYDFEYKCDTAQSIICAYLNDLGVINHPCMTQNVITNDIIGHSFLVAEFNQDGTLVPYLIDPTYRQFFLTDKCNRNNYIYFGDKKIIKTPDPGYFIEDKDKEATSSLLINGYSPLDSNMARIYGDSFYNTKTGLNSSEYRTIPGSIYINSFLKGKEQLSKSREDLINTENILEIQRQKKM